MNQINLPLISIVIPSFNQGEYIEETLLSIFNQDYNNVEVIVMDGGSVDETISILKKYDSRIKKWVSEPDRGQAHAINKGLEYCEGELFNWINSDDFLMPGALSDLVECYLSQPRGRIFCGYTYCFFEENKKESHTYRMKFGGKLEDVFFDLEMNQPGSFVLTKMLKAVGGVNESLRYVFDNELYYRLLSRYGNDGIVYSGKVWAGFRLHEDSKSVADGFERFEEEKTEVLQWIYWNAPGEKLQLFPFLDKKSYTARNWCFDMVNWEKFRLKFYATRLLALAEYNSPEKLKSLVWRLIFFGEFKFKRKNITLATRLFLFGGKKNYRI